MHSSCSYFARSVTVGTEPPFEVVQPDFAIILKFLNHPLTSLDGIEAESQDILRKHKAALKIAKVNPTSDIVRIIFKNGVCTHLIVGNARKDTDIDAFLEKIKCRGDTRRFHSASVGLQHFEYMQKQTEFTILLNRLANYWLKSKDKMYGSGAKVIFELLAVAVAKEEGEGLQESMTSAFIKMGKKIENLDQLRLEFTKTNDISKSTPSVVGDEGVPYLMEPFSVAPNNVLDKLSLKREQMEVLMKTGKEMRESLEKFIETGLYNVSIGPGPAEVEIDFSEMFTK